MTEALFGPGAAAGWIVLLYFIAGALGTAGRVALSPTLENRSVRMLVETLSGGAAGVLLPYLGAEIFGAAAAALPPIAKAALVLILMGSGSFAIGELLARRNGAAVKMILLLLMPALFLAGCTSTFYVQCKGKGAVTAQYLVSSASVQADCSESGFEYYRSDKPLPAK